MNILDSGLIASLGVGSDMIGTIFLLQSFVLKKGSNVVKEALDYMDGNPYRLKNAILQRIDAFTGFTFLFLGFLLQFISNLPFIPRGENNTWFLSVLLLSLAFLLAILITYPIKRRRSRNVVAEEFEMSARMSLLNKALKTAAQFEEEVEHWGDAIGIHKRRNEDIDSYAKRLSQAYKSKTKTNSTPAA